ncbi:Uncharacterised protein [Vibrio cholerae]|nr:Uncharacterised protein [Vibrio cholerae]
MFKIFVSKRFRKHKLRIGVRFTRQFLGRISG